MLSGIAWLILGNGSYPAYDLKGLKAFANEIKGVESRQIKKNAYNQRNTPFLVFQAISAVVLLSVAVAAIGLIVAMTGGLAGVLSASTIGLVLESSPIAMSVALAGKTPLMVALGALGAYTGFKGLQNLGGAAYEATKDSPVKSDFIPKLFDMKGLMDKVLKDLNSFEEVLR